MASTRTRSLGTIEPAGREPIWPPEERADERTDGRADNRTDRRTEAGPAGRPAQRPSAPERVPGVELLEQENQQLRALRLRLATSYSIANGIYADPARPTVPLFAAQDRKIVAYDTRDPTIKAMLDLAQSNRWSSIKVTGDRDFQRRVWIEATARGMQTQLRSGALLERPYQPTPEDHRIVANLRRERGVGNQIESEPVVRPGAREPAAAAARSEASAAERRALSEAVQDATRQAGDAREAATRTVRAAPRSAVARDTTEQARLATDASERAQQDRSGGRAQSGSAARDAQQQAAAARAAEQRTERDEHSRPRRETAREREARHRAAIASLDAYLGVHGVSESVREGMRTLAARELLDRDVAGRPVQVLVVDPSAPGRTGAGAMRAGREQQREREPTLAR